MATSNVIIVNIWEHQVGLYQGANMGLLKTVFEVNLQLFLKDKKYVIIFFLSLFFFFFLLNFFFFFFFFSLFFFSLRSFSPSTSSVFIPCTCSLWRLWEEVCLRT